jgi:uncharacterized damage-inducible protein DinB
VESPRPVEPWLTGSRRDVHPLLAPTLYSYAQAREDLAHWTAELSDAQIWSRPHGLAPVGFHIRHIAGSVERLTTYLKGEQLTTQQLDALEHEMQPGPGREEMLRALDDSLQRSEQVILALNPATLEHPRAVGRKRLPTTVAGLLVHLAEHTQRHVGEAIITAKLAQQRRKISDIL